MATGENSLLCPIANRFRSKLDFAGLGRITQAPIPKKGDNKMEKKTKFTEEDVEFIIRKSELSTSTYPHEGHDYLGEVQEQFDYLNTDLGSKAFIIWQLAQEAYWDNGHKIGCNDDIIINCVKALGWME